jgi:halogenation protein CepH
MCAMLARTADVSGDCLTVGGGGSQPMERQGWREVRMSTISVETCDVVVAGGGPGGSTAATLMARQGHRVLLLERARFPRYQIGESLLPSTVHGVCAMLGVTEELQDANFQIKRGGTFRWGASPEPWTFAFALSRKVAGRTSFAYQVDRARFDSILLDNARRHGVEVREEHQVTGLVTEDGRVCGVRFKGPDGDERVARARYVVVATGNTDVLNKHVGERRYSEFFRNVSLFGYYEGGKRLPAPNQGNILCAAFKDGWFWYIPLSDTLTSVGAVVSRDRAEVIQRGRESAMGQFIASCPLIADHLSSARRVTEGMYGELRVRKDYSYTNTRFCGPGVVLVGDAACFIDPVFSSGVHLATYSGVLAARSINTSLLQAGPSEQACFEEYERRYRREFNVFYQFLLAIYDMNQDQSSYFWTARKILGTAGTDIEAFVDLVAGVSSPEGGLFHGADPKRSSRQFGKVLGNATQAASLDEGDVILRAGDAGLLGSVLQEGGRLQLHAARADSPAFQEESLFPDGLVPSSDGCHWCRAD